MKEEQEHEHSQPKQDSCMVHHLFHCNYYYCYSRISFILMSLTRAFITWAVLSLTYCTGDILTSITFRRGTSLPGTGISVF